jgi:hypothetical protein
MMLAILGFAAQCRGDTIHHSIAQILHTQGVARRITWSLSARHSSHARGTRYQSKRAADRAMCRMSTHDIVSTV